MIQSFEYYEKNRLVRKGVPTVALAKALIEKAELRLARILRTKVHETESTLVFEDIYETIREASQSLMELKGYKPYSHESVVAFLTKEKSLPEKTINIINNYRIMRNNSVYSAENISPEKCTEALHFAQEIVPEIKKKFSELMKK